jgi:predicted ArsR family transcriptional regulator
MLSMSDTQSTRLEILHILRKRGAATAKNLSEILKITLSAVRQQLTILEGERLVISSREAGKRGRPTHHYRLTQEADKYFTKNYVDLSLELIEGLIESAGRKGLKSFLMKRKDRFVAKHREAMLQAKNFNERVDSVTAVQDRSGYMATMKKEGKLHVLEEYNCPFIEVATKYPEFCEMERLAYENLLETDVKLEGCRARGANVCRFCIQPKKQ